MSLNYTNLPPWLERNWFFRKLFLLRKSFLIKSKQKHYAQFAEDVSVSRLFPDGFVGFFVDVGCFHPKKHSNTWKLYKDGWRGINVDIDSIKIEAFRLVRPEDISIACAVSTAEGEVEYWSNGFYSLTVSLDDEYVEGKDGYVKKSVEAKRLSTIIDETKYRDRQIDFLSVDAEGHDLQVLQSLDFEQYDPRLIAVEIHEAGFRRVVETDLYKFLEEKGYSLVGWCGLTLLMANKDLQEELNQRSY